LPRKKGFTNPFRVEYSPINLSQLNVFEAGTEVTPALLIQKRILRNLNKPVKVLATGEVDRALTVTADRFSLTAKEKIKAAGGTVIELNPPVEKVAKETARAKKARREKKKAPPAAEKAAAVEATEAAPKDEGETDSGDGS
jgi:ribosomal protein L18E